jgi:cytochrome P450
MEQLSEPSVSLDIFDPATLDDPYELYDRLRRHSPVYQLPDTDFYLVSTWDAIMEAVERPAVFSSNLTAGLLKTGETTSVFPMPPLGDPVHVLATGDDPGHTRDRKLVLPALVAKRIRALEPVIAAVASELWSSSARNGQIDWMPAMADLLPMIVVAHHLIGLPKEDVPQLVERGYASTEALGAVMPVEKLPDVAVAQAEMITYLQSSFERAARDPGDDLLGDLARAVQRGDIDTDHAINMLVQLIGAGGESTAGLIGNSVRLLAANQELQSLMRDDRTLLVPFLEETLRLESPFRGHQRHVVSDTTLAGTELPENAHLLLLWGAANRDPAVFEDPDDIRLDRGNVRRHLTFGHGAHFCGGAALARTEARIVLDMLLSTTRSFRLADAKWLPSIFVRRHEKLVLEYQ